LHSIYYAKLEAKKDIGYSLAKVPYLSEATLRRVGRVRTGKKSTFINFSKQKPAGVVRIGTFGDSFTFGDEVGETGDYPTQLSRLLEKAGVNNVEVLNFGSPWYSFSQAYILWDEVGKLFDLDVILLGPAGFWADRDTRFNHTNGQSPYYLHSRFVLINGTITRLDPIGFSPAERFQNYYGYWPAWQYLRFDRNAPTVLQAALPAGQTLDNPFYYDWRSETEEANEIYLHLIQEMVTYNKKTIIGQLFDPNQLTKAMSAYAGKALCVVRLTRISTFPYIAPEGHASALGNFTIANQYLSLLLGQSIKMPILQAYDKELVTYTDPPPKKLSEFDEVHIRRGEFDIGLFVSTDLHSQAPTFIRDKNIQSIIALKALSGSILDAYFLGVTRAIDVGSEVTLAFRSGDEFKEVVLGKLRFVDSAVNFAAVEMNDLYKEYREPYLRVSKAALGKYFGKEFRSGEVELRLGKVALMRGVQDSETDDYLLKAANSEIYQLRSNVKEDPGSLPMQLEGPVQMVLVEGANSMTLDLSALQATTLDIDAAAHCPDAWIPPLVTEGH
jgi:hypothetical protein